MMHATFRYPVQVRQKIGRQTGWIQSVFLSSVVPKWDEHFVKSTAQVTSFPSYVFITCVHHMCT